MATLWWIVPLRAVHRTACGLRGRLRRHLDTRFAQVRQKAVRYAGQMAQHGGVTGFVVCRSEIGLSRCGIFPVCRAVLELEPYSLTRRAVPWDRMRVTMVYDLLALRLIGYHGQQLVAGERLTAGTASIDMAPAAADFPPVETRKYDFGHWVRGVAPWLSKVG